MMYQEKSKLFRDVEIQANVFPPPPSPSPAIRLELLFREPVLCTIERNLCSFWAHIVTCLSCSLFFFLIHRA